MHAVVRKTRVALQYNHNESQCVFANVINPVVKSNIDIFIVEYINCYAFSYLFAPYAIQCDDSTNIPGQNV